MRDDIRGEVLWYLHLQEGAEPAGGKEDAIKLDNVLWDVHATKRSEQDNTA